MGGDFNEILLNTKKRGDRPRALWQMRDFHSTLDICGVRDLSYYGEQYTWVNKHESLIFVQERLDRFGGNLEWNRLFSNAQVTNLSFYHYDHRAIKVTFSQYWVRIRRTHRKGRKQKFHFEEIWSTDEECRDVISSAWGLGDNLPG